MSIVRSSRYTCVTCLQFFSRRDLLISHVFSHDLCINSPLYICQYCGLVSSNLSKLYVHKFRETNNVIFKEPSLVELACAFCADTFSSRCSLTKHVFTHVSAVSGPSYVCSNCSKVFKDLKNLQFHENSSRIAQRRDFCDCKTSSYAYKQQLPIAEFHTNRLEKELITADIHNKSFKNKKSYKRSESHELIAACKLHEISCTWTSSLKTNEKGYAIFNGKNSYTISEDVNNHHRFHLGQQSYSCEDCGKSFHWPSGLKRHQQIHLTVRLFSCDVCGKSFTGSRNLKMHQQIHLGEHLFSCDICGKSFTQSGSLKIHQLTHLGERPFSCDICSKTFTQSGRLKIHQRLHLGERPYSCDICGKAFTESGNLKAHQRIHLGERPFSCDICGISFTQSGNLKMHQRLHLGDRPFTCDICGKSFTQSAHQKIHQRIHLGKH